MIIDHVALHYFLIYQWRRNFLSLLRNIDRYSIYPYDDNNQGTYESTNHWWLMITYDYLIYIFISWIPSIIIYDSIYYPFIGICLWYAQQKQISMTWNMRLIDSAFQLSWCKPNLLWTQYPLRTFRTFLSCPNYPLTKEIDISIKLAYLWQDMSIKTYKRAYYLILDT